MSIAQNKRCRMARWPPDNKYKSTRNESGDALLHVLFRRGRARPQESSGQFTPGPHSKPSLFGNASQSSLASKMCT